MQTPENNITDVEFKEVPTETAAPFFNPVAYLTEALTAAKHPEPLAWTKDCDPRAETALEEKERIFFANRALRLYLAEQTDRENLSPRMLLADGIDGVKWAALMDQGVIPWLMNQFDAKGKRIKPEDVQAETENRVGLAIVGETDTRAEVGTMESTDEVLELPDGIPDADDDTGEGGGVDASVTVTEAQENFTSTTALCSIS